jgi:hypothetical protein
MLLDAMVWYVRENDPLEKVIAMAAEPKLE